MASSRAACGQLGRVTPLARGLLVALPVVAGFSFLLTSADAVFGRALDDVLHLPFDLDDVVGPGPVLGAGRLPGRRADRAGRGCTGRPRLRWLRGRRRGNECRRASAPRTDGRRGACRTDAEMPAPEDLARAERGRDAEPHPYAPRWATESLVVLLAVDVLFAAFAAVQVVFLFGGTDTLAAIGMTYSDYARQGYFQLVGVVALAGLLLIGAHQLAGRTPRFLATGLALLVLTGVILASAALRLRLYQDAYGWTELRFFVAASIAVARRVHRPRRRAPGRNRMRWLPHGIAIAAITVTLGVSAIGPQAFVMHQNLARVLDPGLVPPGGHTGFDVGYGMSLGVDAVPDLVAALDALPATERETVLDELLQRRAAGIFDRSDDGPLSWNLARERARQALETLSGR